MAFQYPLLISAFRTLLLRRYLWAVRSNFCNESVGRELCPSSSGAPHEFRRLSATNKLAKLNRPHNCYVNAVIAERILISICLSFGTYPRVRLNLGDESRRLVAKHCPKPIYNTFDIRMIKIFHKSLETINTCINWLTRSLVAVCK